ncbi:LPXTG cell wall anchor domain-containing protein [Aerococcus urinae]|uniref:LPXTG cell wall anchor domain-containing protein n=1 Tax=Aerococcus urinae TaxID=1376 RepID=A0ABT4C5K6_9LACT|nr:LPXTG cell wall anchor domain-containing protein [Aerococcus urinae]MCY3053724.1 LPXTG cell wall anchor domain-containing protein [Aerococcus urinae]
MKDLKKLLLGAAATTAAAGVFFASDVAVAQAAETYNGVTYDYDANAKTSEMTKSDAVHTAKEAIKHYDAASADAKDAENKIVSQEKVVAQEEADLTAAKENYDNKQAALDEANKLAGTDAKNEQEVINARNDALDKVGKAYEDKVATIDKEYTDRVTANNRAEQEAQEAVNTATTNVNNAQELVDNSADASDELKTQYETDLEAAKTALQEAQNALTKATDFKKEDNEAAKKDQEEAKAVAKNELDEQIRQIQFKYNLDGEGGNDRYKQSGLEQAVKDAKAAKDAFEEAEQNLKLARTNLNVYQEQYRLAQAQADKAAGYLAQLSLDQKVDVNEDLQIADKELQANLEELIGKGSEEVAKEIKDAEGRAEAAQNALDELDKGEEAAADEKDPKAEENEKPTEEDPEAEGKKDNAKADKDNKKDGKDAKVVVANEKDEKAKKEAKAEKANAKLPATGVVVGSVAGLGVALVAAGSAFAFRRRK